MYSIIKNCFNFVFFIRVRHKFFLNVLFILDSFKTENLIDSEESNKILVDENERNLTEEDSLDDLTKDQLLTINSNADLTSFSYENLIPALQLIIDVLDVCQNVRLIHDNVFESIFKLGYKFTKDDKIIDFIVDIISYITIIDETNLKHYIYLSPSFFDLLLNIISTSRNAKIIVNSVNALNEMINDKIEIIKLMDGINFFNSAIFVLSKFRESKNYFKFQEPHQKSQLQICQPALILLTKCLSNFSASEELLIKSTNEIRYFLNSEFHFIKPFIISLIQIISYNQSERAINFFSNDIIHYVDLLVSNAIDPAKYMENILGSLSNMVHRSDDFAIFLPSNSRIFDIQPDPKWPENVILNYIRLFDNIFRRFQTSDCEEENWSSSINAIQNNSVSIAKKAILFFEPSSFKIKKNIVLMICQLILIRDVTIMINLFQSDVNFIPIFAVCLDSGDKKLIFEISRTILLLCQSLPQNGINFIDILMKVDIQPIIQDLINNDELDPIILSNFIQIQKLAMIEE